MVLHSFSNQQYNFHIVEYLISTGVDLNSPNEGKNSPLQLACLNGYVEVMKKLIMVGAKQSREDSNG